MPDLINDKHSNNLDTKALFSNYINNTLSGYQCLLTQRPPNLTTAFYDNACSFSVTSDLNLLYDLTLLPEPLALDGLNGGVLLTHTGRFRCLPSTNGFDKGFYSPDLQTTLFSLGHFHKSGGSYSSSTTHLGTDIFTPDGTLLDSPALSAFNLLPISQSLLQDTHFDATPTKPAGHAFPAHINMEMRQRCDDVERLIHRLGFPSDASLCADITGGKIPTHLTAADVNLNRILRGPCPHQSAGKARNPSAPTSTTAPATRIGEKVHFDIAILLAPPPGGCTHEIFFYDEFAGFFGHELSRSKRQEDIMDAIVNFQSRTYLAYGHTLSHLHGDDEAINECLEIPLAKLGITLSLSLPGQHARSVERGIETVRSRATSTVSALPYSLPPKYNPLVHSAVSHVLNKSINTRSSPSTPSEIIHGIKYSPKTIPLQFGSCHLVTQLEGKRHNLARHLHTNYRYIPKTEVAVCMGPDPLTNSQLFLTESGHIGPKVVRSSLPLSFVPFGWKPKPYHPIIPIPKHVVSESAPIPSPTPALNPTTKSWQRKIPGSRFSLRIRDQQAKAYIFSTSILPDILTTQSNTITRKLANQRKATARNAAFRQSLDIGHLNDLPSTVQPTPPPPSKRHEVNTRVACTLWGYDRVKAAEEKELKKILVTYKSFVPIARSAIPPDAIYLRSMALYKQKSDGTVAGRIPIDGASQPPESYGDTFAATTDLTDRLFVLSTVLKDASDRNCLDQLEFLSGDIPAAFINQNKLSQGDTGGRRFITKLPSDLLDKSLAGVIHEVVGAQYGMKQANNIYDQDLNKTMLTGTGYQSSPLHPRIYIRRDSTDPSKYSLVVFYVDDFEHYSTCPILKQDFLTLIKSRYSDAVTLNDPGIGTTGLEYTRHPNHSVTVTVTKYILKLLTKAGMDLVEPALRPSLPNLFHIDPTSPLLDPVLCNHFKTINGILIWLLPVRYDICKEVRWLCKRNDAPTHEDRAKQVQVLRYLKGAPDIGPTFTGKSPDAPGIRIEGASDVGHAVHPDTGASQVAFQLSIGESNAPFKTSCFAETGVISPDPTSAEYTGLSAVTKEVLYWRQVAESLGFPQVGPSIIRQDNNSAINLTVAPQVTRRMRYINVRHHFVRSAFADNLVVPVYTNTNALGSVDMHTKSPSVSNVNQFLYNRSILFNDRAKAYTGRISIIPYTT